MDAQNQLLPVLELSEQILSAIDKKSWETVADLDARRRILIDEYYQNGSRIDAALTRQLKQKNDLILSRLVEMQQQTTSEQIKLNQAHKVSKAYLDNSK